MLHLLATNIGSHRTDSLSERQGVIKHSHRLTSGQNRDNEATAHILKQHASFVAHDAYAVHPSLMSLISVMPNVSY